MKRWFASYGNPGMLWEWDPDASIGHWVNANAGDHMESSEYTLSDFEVGLGRERFPHWGAPPEARVPEGL